MSIETPFAAGSAVVLPEWIDNNGHMNVGYYHVAFDQASDPFFEWLGLTPEFRKRTNCSTFALESHLTFVRELREGAPLRVEARLLEFDHKRIHFYSEMFHGTEGWLAATFESLGVYVDMSKRRTTTMPPELLQRLEEVYHAHLSLPKPWQVGHVISARSVPRTPAAAPAGSN